MFDSLSTQQREFVFNKKGKLAVRACPGSGKTFSVAAKIAYMLNSWTNNSSGIAAISFTNVAWKEIQKYLFEEFKIEWPLRHPHFLGTIDSLINNFIFLPFGHLLMKCKGRPVLVGEPFSEWVIKRYEKDYWQYFSKISFNKDDTLNYPNIPGVFFFGNKFYNNNGGETEHTKSIKEMKLKFWSEGYATQADSNYFAYKLLNNYPTLAKALIERFPVFIIDEAQDTSEIQMGIIDLLIDNGLKDIILLGDPDQAIYEWNNAKPELFEVKFDKWKENSITFNENRRSSQIICDSSFKLSSLSEKSISVNTKANETLLPPEIWIYDASDMQTTIDRYLSLCAVNNILISKESVAVLTRSSNFLYEIFGADKKNNSTDIPWVAGDYITPNFAKAAFYFQNNHYKKAYEIIEKIILKIKFKTPIITNELIDREKNELGIRNYKSRIFYILEKLPSTNQKVGSWVQEINDLLFTYLQNVTLKCEPQKSDTIVDALFNDSQIIGSNLNFRIGTVHSIKGESFNAVLLLVKQKAVGPYYRNMFTSGCTVKNSEELRIIYVGITRPRELLVLGVPNVQDYEAWNRKLLN